MTFFIHHTANWLDATSLLLGTGGIGGGFLRAWLGQQSTWSKRTVFDVVLGAASGVVTPSAIKYGSAIFGYPTELAGPPLFLLAAGVIVGLFGNYVIIAILWRVGVFKEDPRAGKPTEGDKP